MSRAPAPSIPLVLVEDVRVVRDGIAALLPSHGIRVLAATRSGSDVLHRVEHLRPSVVLLDSTASDACGLASRLRAALPELCVVVMDLLPDQADVVEFIRAGAAGFVLRDASIDQLAATVRAVATGIRVLPERLAAVVFDFVASLAPENGPWRGREKRLSSREREVLQLIGDGLANKAIASQLHVSVNTVKSQVHSILTKLSLQSRLQLAVVAREGSATDARRRSDELHRRVTPVEALHGRDVALQT